MNSSSLSNSINPKMGKWNVGIRNQNVSPTCGTCSSVSIKCPSLPTQAEGAGGARVHTDVVTVQ